MAKSDMVLRRGGRMPMNRIEGYEAFTALVEKRSLAATARHLGCSLQSAGEVLPTGSRMTDIIRKKSRDEQP